MLDLAQSMKLSSALLVVAWAAKAGPGLVAAMMKSTWSKAAAMASLAWMRSSSAAAAVWRL